MQFEKSKMICVHLRTEGVYWAMPPSDLKNEKTYKQHSAVA